MQWDDTEKVRKRQQIRQFLRNVNNAWLSTHPLEANNYLNIQDSMEP